MMTREQMEAWCALEGWEPTTNGRFYHRESNALFSSRYHAGLRKINAFDVRGAFDAGAYYESWGAEHDDAFPKLLTELKKP